MYGTRANRYHLRNLASMALSCVRVCASATCDTNLFLDQIHNVCETHAALPYTQRTCTVRSVSVPPSYKRGPSARSPAISSAPCRTRDRHNTCLMCHVHGSDVSALPSRANGGSGRPGASSTFASFKALFQRCSLPAIALGDCLSNAHGVTSVQFVFSAIGLGSFLRSVHRKT